LSALGILLFILDLERVFLATDCDA